VSPRKNDPVLVWERPEPPRRPALSPLSREGIVQAAMTLADREGLEAVSLRNVAGALDAGPMRLYGYVESKEELLELMVDAVYGEVVAAGRLKGPWRTVLRTLAHRIRDAWRAHPWFVELLSGRNPVGPSGLAYMEASLAAMTRSAGFDRIDTAMAALRVLHAYVIGALRNEASEIGAQEATGMDEGAWQTAHWPYLERALATGKFPNIARVVHEARHPRVDEMFDSGLDWVLDGIAAQLQR
jgi:AcrR family transcriptional regulator